MNITIAGAGYVGLVTGICLSSKGRNVTIVDVDEHKIGMLNEGKPPIFEKGLSELLEEYGGGMTFTTDPQKAYTDADVVMLAVPTPERRDGSANLSFIYNACGQIASYSDNGCLVAVKSTVPAGTCDKIERFFAGSGAADLFPVASNPEFLAQGTAVHDTLFPPRIVIGAENSSDANLLKDVYAGFKCEFVMTDRKSAEMIKYASNDFLAMKI